MVKTDTRRPRRSARNNPVAKRERPAHRSQHCAEWLARLGNAIAEGMPGEAARDFRARFDAIPVNSNHAKAWHRFALWLLTDDAIDLAGLADERGRSAIEAVAVIYSRILDGGTIDDKEWDIARHVANNAMDFAWHSAWTAERNDHTSTGAIAGAIAGAALRGSVWAAGAAAYAAEGNAAEAARAATRAVAWTAIAADAEAARVVSETGTSAFNWDVSEPAAAATWSAIAESLLVILGNVHRSSTEAPR